MDTHKIDKVLRFFVMAPIFGFLAFLVLFPVFVSIDAGSGSMDFGALTFGMKKFKVEMDWILATCVGIASAGLVIHQIKQASLRHAERTKQASVQDAERAKVILRKDFRNLVIAAANNIRFSEIREGYLHFDGERIKYIICWRHDEVNPRISQFNMMLRVMEKTDTEILTLTKLRNKEDPNRWNLRILIPLLDGQYGTVSQSSADGMIIDSDLHLYNCISHAVTYIQILDNNEMKKCRADFDQNDLRATNDAYLRTNIVTQYIKVGEANDIS